MGCLVCIPKLAASALGKSLDILYEAIVNARACR